MKIEDRVLLWILLGCGVIVLGMMALMLSGCESEPELTEDELLTHIRLDLKAAIAAWARDDTDKGDSYMWRMRKYFFSLRDDYGWTEREIEAMFVDASREFLTDYEDDLLALIRINRAAQNFIDSL